jgi:heat-inducible transcriptional repressor
MSPGALSDRSRRVLATLVREYIETGEPIASSTLVKRGGFGLSSATIRNILASLEEQGYLHQPHTSAGRVPTDLAYRVYVDSLLEARHRSRSSSAVEAQLREAGPVLLMDEVLTRVSHVLSRVSHHVGFVLATPGDSVFHQVDFVPLSGSRVLVVVVSHGGQVTQKVVDIGELLSTDELRQSANYLNSEFSGLPLSDVREAILTRLTHERTLYDALLSRALRLAQSTFSDMTREASLFIEGTPALVEEASDPASRISISTLGALLKMIEDKHRLVRLLTEYIESAGLTVVIGAEHSTPDLRTFSLVASTYFDGVHRGTVGVIGPTRMRYSRTISVVDGMAQAVPRVLRENTGDTTPRSGC